MKESAHMAARTTAHIEPPCPYYGECGGCSCLDLAYDMQLRLKRGQVLSSLMGEGRFERERAEELVSSCLPSKREHGYRNKMELAAAFTKKAGFLLGFKKQRSKHIAQVNRCLLAHEEIARVPKALRGALRFAQGTQDLGIYRVGLRHSRRTGDLEVALWTSATAFPRAHVAKLLQSALPATSIVRVVADPGKHRKVKQVEVLAGKGCWEEELAGIRFLTSAPSFFQVNTEQAELLVEAVVEGLALPTKVLPERELPERELPAQKDPMLSADKLLENALPVKPLVADLYAGGGSFALALAKRGARVVAVEAASSSVKDLRRNVELNEVDVEVVGGDSAREIAAIGSLDALVVDPPRAGLAEDMAARIAAARPKRIAYVSCNPATWARDVARLEGEGYRLAKALPVDLFPQTRHVEVVSILEKEKR